MGYDICRSEERAKSEARHDLLILWAAANITTLETSYRAMTLTVNHKHITLVADDFGPSLTLLQR